MSRYGITGPQWVNHDTHPEHEDVIRGLAVHAHEFVLSIFGNVYPVAQQLITALTELSGFLGEGFHQTLILQFWEIYLFL